MLRTDGENWLRLHLTARDSMRMRTLVRRLGSASDVLDVNPKELLLSGDIDKGTHDRLIRACSDEITKKVGETVELCRKNGWRIITPQSPLYPERLLKLARFPFVLYADGDITLLKHTANVSVVGTRLASQKARAVAFKLAYGLSQSGVCVISGGALGIDASSHEGALCGKTGTVGVLGAGLGSGYLKKNADLRKRIASHGLIITELNPFEAPSKYTFPERNRIIACLGDVCCVVESGTNGGSLITADRAREMNKPLVIPSRGILESDGCNILLERGAREAETVGDILGMLTDLNAEENGISDIAIAPDYDVDFTISGFKEFFFDERTEDKNTDEEKSKAKKKAVTSKSDSEKADGNTSQSDGEKTEAPEKRHFTAENEPTLFTVSPISENEKAVLDVLGETPISLDKIVELTGLKTDEVASSLTLLELRGKASSYYGNLYSL